MSVRNRIASTLTATAFGQAVTVGSQLLLTPLYFRYWGAATYGEWLLLSTIPAYLAMADLGIGSAAANEMSMRAIAGNRQGARQTFFSALWVSASAGVLSLLLGALAAVFALTWLWPAKANIAPSEAAVILLALAATVGVGFASGVVGAGYRCADRNALGATLTHCARLADALAIGLLLWMGESPVFVCLASLVVKLTMFILIGAALKGFCPWLFVLGTTVDRGIIRRLISPALGFLALPLGNALALQGPVLIIGATLGSPAVAIFTALRTLARIPIQITNMINASVWPEMTRAFGAGNFHLLRRLHHTAWGTTLLTTIFSGVLLLLSGERLTKMWLGDQNHYDGAVFACLVLISVLSAMWGASGVVLAAINEPERLGAAFVAAVGIALGVATLLTARFGWAGLLVPLVLADFALLVWGIGRTIKVTDDTLSRFTIEVLTAPWQRLSRLLRR